MSKSQRTKGAVFERSVCKELSKALGFNIQRNLSQTRDSGADILVGDLVVECKIRKSIVIYKWLRQAIIALSKTSQVPIVVARADHEDTVAIIPFDYFLRLLKVSYAMPKEDGAQKVAERVQSFVALDAAGPSIASGMGKVGLEVQQRSQHTAGTVLGGWHNRGEEDQPFFGSGTRAEIGLGHSGSYQE